MGAESFFISVLFQGVEEKFESDHRILTGDIKLKQEDFIQVLKGLNLKLKKNFNECYFLDNSLKLCLYIEDDQMKGFSLEGCFAWYDKNIDLLFLILNKINRTLMEIYINKPFIIYSDQINYDFFKSKIREYNLKRYKYFVELFGMLEFKTLPDSQFYKKLPLQKMIKKIRSFLASKNK